jgi:hypothetical protein
MVAACAPVVVGGPTARVPGDDGGTRLPRPASTAVPASSAMRYICRGATRNGWIAIDYIADSEVCATGATSSQRYNTAVIVPLSGIAVGGMLEVCADERIPQNWSLVRVIPGDPRCPGDTPNTERATVREIRRDR